MEGLGDILPSLTTQGPCKLFQAVLNASEACKQRAQTLLHTLSISTRALSNLCLYTSSNKVLTTCQVRLSDLQLFLTLRDLSSPT